MFDSEPFLATPFLFLCDLKTTSFCFKVQKQLSRRRFLFAVLLAKESYIIWKVLHNIYQGYNAYPLRCPSITSCVTWSPIVTRIGNRYIQCLPCDDPIQSKAPLYAIILSGLQNPKSSSLRLRTLIFSFIGGITCCPNHVFAGLVSSGSIS